MAVAGFLAERYPSTRFRSGNAEGSDEAFSKGIAGVDPSRLQIISPYQRHRIKARIADASYTSPEALDWVQEEDVATKTVEATPKNKGLIQKRAGAGRIAAKASYLIRDTMKVTGFSEEFPKAVAALFYVDTADPMAGGTGHTVRVCQNEGVPYAFQDSWQDWTHDGC